MLIAIENMMGATPDDLAKFARDKSGRLPVPRPGTEATPARDRVWASLHAVMHQYLATTRYTNALAASYQRFFGERLAQRFPVGGEWREASVLSDIL